MSWRKGEYPISVASGRPLNIEIAGDKYSDAEFVFRATEEESVIICDLLIRLLRDREHAPRRLARAVWDALVGETGLVRENNKVGNPDAASLVKTDAAL